MIEVIDTHAHLTFDAFSADLDEVVAAAANVGVCRIIVPGVDLQNCTAVLQLAERFRGVFAAVGVHPNSTDGWQDDWVSRLRELAQHEKVVAIGEIGLDYYWNKSPVEMQKRAFKAQMALAAEMELPIIIHNREAGADVIDELRRGPLLGRKNPGVLHSFSGDGQMADAALDLGYFFGFTGPVTFKKADELRRLVAGLPLERILVETDAPFLTPHPYRGKRNEPARVLLVAERIAALHRLSTAEFAAISTANAEQLFSLPATVRPT